MTAVGSINISLSEVGFEKVRQNFVRYVKNHFLTLIKKIKGALVKKIL